uniref:AB hydrolase-1 domain-containing protein n=1 Tax=Glycine max TaxID=3847 RepID=A0A0R0KSQ8_SOYBN
MDKTKRVSFLCCFGIKTNGLSVKLLSRSFPLNQNQPLHVIIAMTLQAFHGSACCFRSHLLHFSSSTASSPPFLASRRFQSCPSTRKSLKLNCSSSGNNGDQVKAYSIPGTGEKAKDPIFGLAMGSGSQATGDRFRWFCVESGSADNPSVILIHGFPSQAYSYRKVLPVLSKDYHVIAFDWLGFGFSDKPQPRYGFDYTLDEYVSSLESLIDELAATKVSLVVQGYFSPVVAKYASIHQEKVRNLILLNPPLTAQHAKLPPTLSIFSNFLLGEIFSQDPLRASDKALTSCGPYKMKEEDAMVYRRPYLTSGSSGFALNAISRNMNKDLKRYVEDMQTILKDKNWKVQTTICWGQRDRWLSYDGVEDFCKDSNHKLIDVPTAGHHVQEDCGEEVGQLIRGIISKRTKI